MMSCVSRTVELRRLTKGVDDSDITNEYYCFGGSNVTGAERTTSFSTPKAAVTMWAAT